jgi:hypothetical protein
LICVIVAMEEQSSIRGREQRAQKRRRRGIEQYGSITPSFVATPEGQQDTKLRLPEVEIQIRFEEFVRHRLQLQGDLGEYLVRHEQGREVRSGLPVKRATQAGLDAALENRGMAITIELIEKKDVVGTLFHGSDEREQSTPAAETRPQHTVHEQAVLATFDQDDEIEVGGAVDAIIHCDGSGEQHRSDER